MSIFVEGDVVVYEGELVCVEKFRQVVLSNFGMNDYTLYFVVFADGRAEWVNGLYLRRTRRSKV